MAVLWGRQLLALFAFLAHLGVFTLLVGNTAAGFAGRLAGCLAFTAAAILSAAAQVTGLNSLDMFHGSKPPINNYTKL